jgi:proteasome accessory factor C
MQNKENSNTRILQIFFRLLNGETLSSKKLSEEYGRNVRTIQRDIKTITDLVEQGEFDWLVKSKEGVNDQYSMELLSLADAILIGKMILGAGILPNESLGDESVNLVNEFEGRIKKLLSVNNRTVYDQLLKGERINYHSPILPEDENYYENFKAIIEALHQGVEIHFQYLRSDDQKVVRSGFPTMIHFSAPFFYVLFFSKKHLTYVPYRLDRMLEIKLTKKKNKQIHENRMPEHELKKLTYQMRTGKERLIKFHYWGREEYVYNNFPLTTVKGLTPDKHGLILETRAIGEGFKFWALSQGAKIKVIEPPTIVKEMQEEIEQMNQLYTNQ